MGVHVEVTIECDDCGHYDNNYDYYPGDRLPNGNELAYDHGFRVVETEYNSNVCCEDCYAERIGYCEDCEDEFPHDDLRTCDDDMRRCDSCAEHIHDLWLTDMEDEKDTEQEFICEACSERNPYWKDPGHWSL